MVLAFEAPGKKRAAKGAAKRPAKKEEDSEDTLDSVPFQKRFKANQNNLMIWLKTIATPMGVNQKHQYIKQYIDYKTTNYTNKCNL